MLLANPYVMFEIKKNPQILIEFLDGTKKVQLTTKKGSWLGKKVRLGFRGFRKVFLLLANPYVMFEIKKKPSNSY